MPKPRRPIAQQVMIPYAIRVRDDADFAMKTITSTDHSPGWQAGTRVSASAADGAS
ncbi:MAG TPA: hypothetical protein VNH42_04045 [Mariprofundaceae bacterium]|nr:hypothetical protein [Mariprofundaceae bacterium]